MHKYFIKTPWLVRQLFSSYVWKISTSEKNVYLTFDDGPHPVITPLVLDELKKHHALATFFCIGKNVRLYPEVYKRITDEGHAVGNHTNTHRNGWTTPVRTYLDDVADAAKAIRTDLFRPPYGRIRTSQAKGLSAAMGCQQPKIIMWDVLSADFDRTLSPENCLQNVLSHTEKGSIIVFHDSEKALVNLQYVLPRALEELAVRGYKFPTLK